jgi:hypothetical protein
MKSNEPEEDAVSLQLPKMTKPSKTVSSASDGGSPHKVAAASAATLHLYWCGAIIVWDWTAHRA